MKALELIMVAFVIGLALVRGGPAGAREQGAVHIAVDCARETGEMPHLWQITHQYADMLLRPDMQQQVPYAVGSIPHNGIRFIRVHDLLDLVAVEGFETGNPKYDWSRLDWALDTLMQNGLKPFFEIMGNPKGLPNSDGFKGYSPEVWRQLTKDVALHCIEKYGRDEVRSWYFETWNEPEGALNPLWDYYDACSEGLKEVDEKLRFGGPGTFQTLGKAFTGLLEHCDKGKNYFTDETGVRMDFISVHEKGIKRTSLTDANPNMKEWVDRQIGVIKYIRTNHPRFADLPYINDECDPKGGIHQQYRWRGGPYFPAIMARYTDHHTRRIVDGLGVKQTILCDDAAQIGDWGLSSYTVRFGDAAKFEQVKLPLASGIVMHSLLGDRRCAVTGPTLWDDYGVIATRRGNGQVALMVYNCNEVGLREKHDDAIWVIEKYGRAAIKLAIEGLPFDQATLVHYRIDKEHSNPQGIWQEMGEPTQPTADQLAKMRQHQEIAMIDGPRQVVASGGKLELDFDLPMPGVSLILLSAKPAQGPGRVTGLRAEKSPSLLGLDEALLVWKGLDLRTIRTYEVLYSDSPGGPFERANEGDLICTAFLHVRGEAGSKGYYKVRAVDYWGRAGEESEAVSLP